MSQNTEQIEAKLCAYIDGELDAAGRDEIERHLVANPEHRQLIAELMQTRDVLRSLPRAPAPGELAEALSGQMERSALLDGALLEDSPATVRLNRWPQLMALAAILVMTVGLGIVVYFVISPTMQMAHDADVAMLSTHPPTSREPRVSVIPGVPETPGESRDVVFKDFGGGSGGRTETAHRSGSAGPDVAAAPAPPDGEIAAKTDAFAKGSGVPVVGKIGKIADPTALFNAGRTQQRSGENLQRQNALFMVVSTDNLAITNSQATNFLKSNGIPWEQVDEQMPAPVEIDVSDEALASRLNTRQRVQLRTGGDLEAQQSKVAEQNRMGVAAQDPGINAKGGGNQINALDQRPAQTNWPLADAQQEKGAPAAVAAKPSAEQTPAADRGISRNVAKSAAPAEPQVSQPVAATPAANEAEQQLQQPAQQDQSQQRGATEQQQLAIVVKVPQDVAGQQIDNLYVVRGMSKQKARELKHALANTIDDDVSDAKANSGPLSEQKSEQQQQQKIAYGVNAKVRLVEALSEAANESDETADRLPAMLNGIVNRYFDVSTAMPMTQGQQIEGVSQATEDRDKESIVTAQVTTQPSQAAIAGVEGVESPADDRVDVVIMVQSAAAAAPATQPANAVSAPNAVDTSESEAK